MLAKIKQSLALQMLLLALLGCGIFLLICWARTSGNEQHQKYRNLHSQSDETSLLRQS